MVMLRWDAVEGAGVEVAPKCGFGFVEFETQIRHPKKMLSKQDSGGWQGSGQGDLEPLTYR